MKILGEDNLSKNFISQLFDSDFEVNQLRNFLRERKIIFEIGRSQAEQRSSCAAFPLHIDVILLKMAEITAQRPLTHLGKIICCKRWDRTQLDQVLKSARLAFSFERKSEKFFGKEKWRAARVDSKIFQVFLRRY